MRWILRCILMSAILGGATGCVQKSAKLQKSIAPPDKTLFETGSGYLKKGQYIKSRLAFQTLLNTYPDSDVAADTYFAMGDSFYEEGGTDNWLQAEDQYKNFIVFYPGNPRSADAQMKIISLNYKMMRTPDRDQQYAHRALQEIKNFEQRYADSDFLPVVRKLKVLVEDNLARGDLNVGRFYADRGNLLGAQLRFREIVEKYPNFEDMDAVLFQLGELARRVNNSEMATDYYAKLAKGYPYSKLYDETKARLIAMGKAIPDVDKELAASNQARLSPGEGFSPLRPLIDFGKALGFVPLPDQYNIAKQSAESEKARIAQAAAAKAAADGLNEDGDFQIESEIRKSASAGNAAGNAAAAGAGSGGTEPEAEDADKKKNSRYKRKK